MNTKKTNENHSIGCSVDTCKYHSRPENLCTLNCIEVGCCHDPKPASSDATRCQSFQAKTSMFE